MSHCLALSLLEFSGCSVEDLRVMVGGLVPSVDPAEIVSFAEEVDAHLPEYHDFLTPADANIILYVTGALVRRIFWRRKCADCKALLVHDDNDAEDSAFSMAFTSLGMRCPQYTSQTTLSLYRHGWLDEGADGPGEPVGGGSQQGWALGAN